MKIIKMLDLSLAHIRPEDEAALIAAAEQVGESGVRQDEWVAACPENPTPDTVSMAHWALLPMFKMAREYQCDYIRFSASGEICPVLPIYQRAHTPA